MADGLETRSLCPFVEQSLVTVAPGLQPLHVVAQCWFRCEEVLLEICLWFNVQEVVSDLLGSSEETQNLYLDMLGMQILGKTSNVGCRCC